MKHWGIVVCVSAVCLLAMAFPNQAAAANPILIVTSSSNPYTTFLPEILHTEGLNEFDTADISVVTSTTLSAYDLVVLGDTSLTAAQVTTFTTWVSGGGNLIAMHPDPQLAGLLGLVDTGTALSNAYVLMNTSAGPGVGLVGQTIQFHGPAELYTLNGATSYATLYSSASTATTNPAVTLISTGSGQAAAFTYDLARSVVLTREGNPAWSGQARDSANAPPIRSYNLWYGGSLPDYIDWNKIQIPQADEQQRLLANLMLQMNSGKKPLPRFWYLPKGLKAAVVMTGDDHGSYYGSSATANRFSDFLAASPTGCNVANWECVRGTAYLFPKIIATNSLTNTQVASYISQGFEIGVHVDSATDCQDWTTTQLDAQYTSYLASLASQFASVPAPQTHRMHCVSWSDYDSQPTIELKHGIRFDTTHYYWPQTWINDRPGLLTGSGMPMRYADRNGNVINVYQAATQMTDESGQSYPLHINTLLDNALSGSAYYGVFTANMHNDATEYPGPGAAFIVASAQARGVPVVTSLQMLQWLDGRNASSFGSLAWSGNVLSFTVTVGTNANNLRAMLPTNFGSLGLSGLLLGSSPVTYQLQTVKGVQYAVFAATAGNYQATYGGAPLFSISGAISPAAVASGTTITATGPVTVTASPDGYGSYSLNGLPSGTYTVTPSKSGYSFTPASQSVTLSGASAGPVNFSLVQTCPCSLWNNTTVPGTPNAGDASAIEVGVRFRADVAGNITGIRFYKSSSNTGTHVGNLWSNTGTKLGTATFSNETASGWQQVNFATPVAIAANTVYVASYHTTTGNYSDDAGYFASSYDFAPLHGVQDATGGHNGVYRYGNSAFPNSTYESDNYWVDVVFSPAGSYSLSGTISGTGGNGATMTLSGAGTATVTASASGTYTFSNLAAGSYTVTPSKAGFAFSPVSQAATVSNANVTGINFSTVTYSISGTISGLGGNGATVNLTGTSTATATADASGNYTFTGLGNGSYTVTPSKAGFTFTPANLAATVNNANVTAVNFSTTTYSISGTISGLGGNGATVNLTGTATATVTADASGNYTFSGLNNGSYTVTPSKAGFTFTPASLAATVNSANVTAVNFSTVTYSISGTISGTGGSGATVQLTGAASATVTADTSGNFTFTGVANGSYTVTPSKSGFGFTPPNQSVTVSGANVTGVSFTTAALTYTLQGTISGTGGSGATVQLSGTSIATVTADASGNYTFTVVNGSYTVTPSKTGFTFTPTSQNVTVSSANVTGVNFSTVIQSFNLQGTISGPGGSGATVNLTGTSTATATADTSGNYSFAALINGPYTVTPSLTGFAFSPSAQPVTVNGANVTGVNFSSSKSCPCSLWSSSTVPGTVNSSDPNAVELGARFQADQAGSITGIRFYKSSANTGTHIGNLWTNTGTLLATATFTNETASGWQQVSFATPVAIAANTTYVASYFTPAGNYSVDQSYFTSAFNNAPLHGVQDGSGGSNGLFLYSAASAFPTGSFLSSNYYVDVVFVGAQTYSVSGTISGPGGSGATVNLTGASTGTATADASGNYTFSSLLAGSYTIAPSKLGFTFTPPSQNVAVTTANLTGVNFTSAAAPTFTLSGTISGAAGSGSTVQLSGTASATATADTSGNYSFTVVNGSYTVTPSKSGFGFAPASQNVTVNGANVTGVNFSTTAQTFTLQGTISGPGGSGASVNLGGASGGTATADGSGNYTFAGLVNGSYTVTPSKAGFNFSPGTLPVTVNGANVTGANISSFQNCPCNLWSSSTVPGTVSAADPSAIELGVRFTSDLAGSISGIRFYKGSSNTGTHIGNLWTNTGTLLATATFSNETTSGWQQVNFATPVAISANTTYVASYNTSSGNYSYDQNYFTNAYNNAPLHGVQDGSSAGANGLFLYGATAFPTGTFLSTNYYVDVVFTSAATLSSVTLNPTSVTGGSSSTGTVTLSGAAPTGGAVVTLSSNNAAATVPASVTVAANATTATFTVTTTAVASTASATITGTYSGGTQTGTLTVNPPVVSPLTLNPTSVTGGTSSTGTVTLGSAAPTGGLAVTLSSNNAAATVPASVTVAAGATTATFTVTTTAVASTASATISATFNGGTQTATLTVNPPVVSAVTLNPTSVTGGTSSTGTVTLGSAAPTGGLAVALSSNNAAATVPASVTVAAGATTATFTVTTTTVTSTASATISATFNGGTQTATLTVNPSGGSFSISGTISNAGGNAATVTLSGAANATVTASATGTYTFSNLANGSYTVTPSKSGYIFTPANKAVTVNGANVTAVNFTSTAQLVIDKTASTDRSTASTSLVSPAFTTTSTNELLLAFVSSDASSAGITVSNMTGGSLTWTMVKRTNTQLGTSEIWRAFSPAILTNATVTATLSQSVAASITVVTFTGVDTTGSGGSGAIGATGTGNSAKGAPTASLTTTRNNSWVIGVGNDYDNATSRTVPTGQTMVHQYLATTGDTFWVQRQTSTTPTLGTVVTINDTAPTGDRYNLTTVEVLPAQ